MPHDYASIQDALEERATVRPEDITSDLIAGLKDAERVATADRQSERRTCPRGCSCRRRKWCATCSLYSYHCECIAQSSK